MRTLTRAALVLIVFLVVAGTALRVDWSAKVAFADGVAAVATAGALAATVWLLYNETSDSRRRREDERARSARHVSAWVVLGRGEDADVTVVVRNGGDEPVYGVRAFISPQPDGVDGRVGYMAQVLPPRKEGSATVTLTSWDANDGDPVVELQLTDAAGSHWRRAPDGRLHPLDDRDLDLCWNLENDDDVHLWG